MKKLIAIVLTLCVLCTGFATFADEEATPAPAPFTFRNGITFGMNVDSVIAAEAARRYDLDWDRTRGANFTELEFEHVIENNVPADLTYLFVDDKLVAIRVDFETRDISVAQVEKDLTEKFGTIGALDMAALGNGIFAVDDDGRLEHRTEAINCGGIMIVIEMDRDDIEVTFVDLTAAYVAAR